MKVLNVKQGTHEWMMARAGLVTGTKAADVTAFLKRGGETAARANYRAQLVAEILTGQPQMDGYLSPFMEWGIEQEQFARAAYELQEGVDVDLVGFVLHPTIARCGGSPDGLVGDSGGVEFKCPKTSTHIKWMLEGVVPEEHQPQMFFYMACTGRAWWDFSSYDPRLPRPLQFFTMRLQRDEARIAEMEEAIVQFNSEIDLTITYLRKICGESFELPKPKPASIQSTDGMLTEEDFVGLV